MANNLLYSAMLTHWQGVLVQNYCLTKARKVFLLIVGKRKDGVLPFSYLSYRYKSEFQNLTQHLNSADLFAMHKNAACHSHKIMPESSVIVIWRISVGNISFRCYFNNFKGEIERKLIIKYLANISSIWCLTIAIGLWIIVRCRIQLNSESKDISQFPERQELKYGKVFKIQSKPNLKIWNEEDPLQGQMSKSGK